MAVAKALWFCLGSILLGAGLGWTQAPSDLSHVVLSYQENPTWCIGCPKFRVDFRDGGTVVLTCRSGCAIPGVQHYRIPESGFRKLVLDFYDSDFFTIPRLDTTRVVFDVTVIELSYRDERGVHETVDDARELATLTELEHRVRAAANLDKFLKPTAATYQELLKSGWNVNSVGEDQENALTEVVLFNDLEKAKFLLQNGATVSERALLYSTRVEDAALAELLLSAAHTNVQSSFGGRLLMSAANRSNDVTRLLLQKGTDVNFRDPSSGERPLMAAVGGGMLDTAGALIAMGADVNAQDQSGRTALMRASTQTNSGFITLLVDHGARVNARDSSGNTALMHASDLCFNWNIEALLKAGADPNITDSSGQTAIQHLSRPDDQKCRTSKQLLELATRK
jgi:ankyrin repeat protein